MTVSEIYNQTIKDLPIDDRLSLARLILDDLPPALSPVRDKAHLEQLLLDGLNSGDAIEADGEYWEAKQKRVVERLGPP